MSTNNTDQIRRLNNRFHFAGALAELDPKPSTGIGKNGVEYFRFSGAIQCGEDKVKTIKFKTFVSAKKHDGTDSPNFQAVKDWYNTAVPMTTNPDRPTYVDITGNVLDNPYVNRDGKLVEGTEYRANYFNDFVDYCADIDIEGFIHSIVDEEVGEEKKVTGRKKIRLISRDVYGKMLDFKNIILPKEVVDDFESAGGYKKGATATLYLSLIPNEAPKKTGGFGIQRTSGRNYLELQVVGADQPSTGDKALDRDVIGEAMAERKSELAEIEAKGYLGGSNASKTSGARAGFGNTSKSSQSTPVNNSDDDDDDDLPF